MVNFSNLSKLADKAKGLAGQHGDKIDQAIDKGVQAADKATKGKYGDRLTGGADKLKDAVAGVADKDAPKPAGGVTPVADATAGTGTGAAAKPATGAVPAPKPVVDADGGPTPDPDAPKGAA